MRLSCNFIGTGKLGKTLAKLLVTHHLIEIKGIYNRNQSHTQDSIAFIGQGTSVIHLKDLPPAKIIFITTPDDAISSVCDELAIQPLQPGTLIVHCSGALSSHALSALKPLGCHLASIHPMHSFTDPVLSAATFSGTYCAMEGDPQAIEQLTPLFKAIGAHPFTLTADKKSLYHAGSVFASNYLVTLAEQALSCFQSAGINKQLAMNMILTLMKNTLANLEHTGSAQQALTGPIQRGDVLTVERHMDALKGTQQQQLYALLGKSTLALTDHTKKTLNILETALAKRSLDEA